MRTLTKTKYPTSFLLISSAIFSLGLATSALADEEVVSQSATSFSLGSMKKLSNQSALLSTMIQLQEKSIRDSSLSSSNKQQNAQLDNKTRVERLKEKQNVALEQSLSTINKRALQKNSNIHHSFVIDSAYVQLIEDIDEDGFYQTFSVTFDSDVLTEHADNQAIVYADLYLSKNGGPWVHYFTTDNFSIYGNSIDDEYEVYTTLNQGYIPAEYDVLIDLYEPGFEEIVARYSSNDSNNLYALPLESSDYDPDYVVVVEHSTSHGHGGSNSILGLLTLMLLTLARKTIVIKK